MKRLGILKFAGRRPPQSFTLIELLVVMTIIAILMALILAAGIGLWNTGARSRAKAEIQAMSAAAESYKVDNGIYPQGDGNLLTNSYAGTDGSVSGGEYQANSGLLFLYLSGQTNFATAPLSGTKVYMAFKINQVGNPSATTSYVQDPWRNSYGYNASGSGTTNAPYCGSGFFDLWSTGGLVGAKSTTGTATWLCNWTL
jgi:prepilin-type N-terminal cleavage/methylation domain-containing protein